jgi:transposase
LSDLYWLTDEQMARLEPYFPKSHGKPRVDDRRVLSGIIFVNRNGLRWRDAPKDYGPHKTLYNRWKRWGEMGVFTRMLEGLSSAGAERKTVMIDAPDANGRPLSFFMTAGQISDYIGAAALLDELPKAQWLLADRGYDADWFREAFEEKGIKPCIPGRKSRNTPIKYDKRRYRRRSRIEIMFGRLKDWRRVATRYDRCPTAFFSAIALAATVIFWL